MTDTRPHPEPLDPSGPWARQEQTFPKLSGEMISAVTGFGQEEAPAPGTLLFERGQRSLDFFLVLQGNIEVFELDLADIPHLLRLIGPGSDAEGRALSSPFVTSRPGIFAVGEVRSGSVKRVVSGVGAGSVVVQVRFLLRPTCLWLERILYG